MTENLFVEEDGVDYSQDSFMEESKDSSKTQENMLIWNEKVPLFSEHTNPNRDIFVVPTLEGADKDDQWNGSIGDAMMEHVNNMSHRQWDMEHYIHMPNGNIFRVEQTVAPSDEDGSRRIGKDIMTVLTADSKTSPEEKKNLIAFLQSEIEENKKRNEDREDAMDQILVSYEDWESKPQMTRDWDIPTTPKPLYIYSGNSSQIFYDHFPEGHPDSKLINSFISISNNIEWDDWSENTIKYFQSWLDERTWSIKTVPLHLMDFCNKMAFGTDKHDPTDTMADTLDLIDREWGYARNKTAISKYKTSAPVREMVRFYNHNKDRHAAGELMWSKVGKLGRSFFKHGKIMTSAHWTAYFRLKKVFAPKICIGEIDFNRAGMQTLTSFFKDECKAKKVFFARPFMSLEDLATLNLITAEDIKGNAKNSVLISMIKTAGRKSVKNNTMSYLGKLAQQLVDKQTNKPELMTEEEWSIVWQTYRICKEQTKNSIGLFN